MKNVFIIAFLLGFLSSAAVADSGGYDGLISAGGDTAAQRQQEREEKKAQQQAEQEKVTKELKKAKHNQQMLEEHAKNMERNSNALPGETWTESQEKIYKDSLRALEKQQKELEEQARLEMERALKK